MLARYMREHAVFRIQSLTMFTAQTIEEREGEREEKRATRIKEWKKGGKAKSIQYGHSIMVNHI